jgi:hypothetical protein
MTVTTVKIQSEVREHLARVAAEDYPGATLSDAVAQLLAEHEQARLRHRIAAAYARLREDPAEWAAYTEELGEWDGVTADGVTADGRGDRR